MPSIATIVTSFGFGMAIGVSGVAASTMMTRGAHFSGGQAMQAGAFMGTMFVASAFVRER